MLRGLLLALVALSALAFVAVGWLALAPPAAPTPVAVEAPPPARVSVLVAARPLRAGALLRGEDLVTADFEAAAVTPGARHDDPATRAALVGAMLRRSLAAGEAPGPDDVLRPGDRGFLAAVLGPDKRAFAVQVDAVTGAAGLIWPGDRVDLLLTQHLPDESLPAFRRTLAETVLTDVRVIAVDQALMQGAVSEAPENGNRPTRTVTLEVTPRQAEVAAVATRLGRLSLVVRSATEDAALRSEAAPRPVWSGDVSPGLLHGRASSAPPQSLQIFMGGTRREEYRF